MESLISKEQIQENMGEIMLTMLEGVVEKLPKGPSLDSLHSMIEELTEKAALDWKRLKSLLDKIEARRKEKGLS